MSAPPCRPPPRATGGPARLSARPISYEHMFAFRADVIPVLGLGELSADHVAEGGEELGGGGRGAVGGAVVLLEGVVEVAVVEGDERLAEGGGMPRVEGGV